MTEKYLDSVSKVHACANETIHPSAMLRYTLKHDETS